MPSDIVWDLYVQAATATPGIIFDCLAWGPTALVVFALQAVGL